MNTANQPKNNRLSSLNHTQIAKAIFAAAESMGMADRKQIEQLTGQIIERLEKSQIVPALPGMEHLVPKQRHQTKHQCHDGMQGS